MSAIEENLPEITEDSDLSPTDRKIARIKEKMINLLDDAVDVVHTAIQGKTWKDTGKQVTRTQLYAATPIVGRFAPEIEKVGSGAVHLHLNIPRPMKDKLTNQEPITVQGVDVTGKAS